MRIIRLLLVSALLVTAFGWAGCDLSIHPIRCDSSVTCSDHGRCEIQNGAQVCLCDAGYVGVTNLNGIPDCLPDEEGGQDGGDLDGDGLDGGPADGGEPDAGPADPGEWDGGVTCEEADCSQPGLPGQGDDQDGDLWGECCDCDDSNEQVFPGRSELLYNCIDDDCDDLTPDDDLDNDGFGASSRICDPGSDCDDRDSMTHPGAVEVCDLQDNNCDGNIDEGCTGCPEVGGDYRVEPNCMMLGDANVFVVQDGCMIEFDLEGIPCVGSVDAEMNLVLQCAGIPVDCYGVWSIAESFEVTCSADCTFRFTRLDGDLCTYHEQPTCTDRGKLCGVVGVAGQPETRCVDTVAGGREPGYYCNPSASIDCVNSLCLDGYCGAVCETNQTCDAFPGTSCQTVAYNDGQGTAGDISSCALLVPDETLCGRTPECSPQRVCSYRATSDSVRTVCRIPIAGGGAPGEPCSLNSDCQNNLCVCAGDLCEGSTGRCSAICRTDSDCLQGFDCSLVPIPDLLGQLHLTPACIRDQESCGHDDDCPAGKCCQLFISQTGDFLESICYWGAGDGESNTGESCSNGSECCTATCFDHPGFCLGLCYVDADCPSFDALACSSDADCELGYLCEGSTCTRNFSCRTQPFVLGQDIIDTANICIPDRRICHVPSDCRAGEACRQYFNDTATDLSMQCDVGGPGEGLLGEDCTTGGEADCWNGLCLPEEGGQAGQYCTQACIDDIDCGDPQVYYCGSVRQEIRPGIEGFMSVCIKRTK